MPRASKGTQILGSTVCRGQLASSQMSSRVGIRVGVQDLKVLWMSSHCLSPETCRTRSWNVKKLRHSLWRGIELSRTDPELARAAVVPSRVRPSSAILRTRRGLRLELFAGQRLQNDAGSRVVSQERLAFLW